MAYRIGILLIVATLAQSASAVKIADITRIDGQQSNVLQGWGLVYGLKGTGDGGDFAPAIKPLREMLARMDNPVAIKDLNNVANVALVYVTATLPPNGVQVGDRVDVNVVSMGAASSLKGGRLCVSFLRGLRADIKEKDPLAIAEGPIVIEDPSTPTVAVVKRGASVEKPFEGAVIDQNTGKFFLIIDEPAAGWPTANIIANMVNDGLGAAGEILATARSEKVVEITIPASERQRPDGFIAQVQRLPIPILNTEARVQINERTGTMVITGDVEISAVVISHKGLTISTVTPPLQASVRTPVTITKDVVAIDPNNTGGAKLQDLVAALDQLKVPAEDRITIIKELHKTGKLHAKLVTE